MSSLSSRYLYVKKRSVTEWLMGFLIGFPLVQAALIEFLSIPDVIRFACDLCIIALVLRLIITPRLYMDRYSKPFLAITATLTVFTMLCYLFRYQSLFYYFWGFRNNYRFILAFLSFALWLSWEDARQWVRWLEYAYYLNFLLILIQFMLGYRQDHLGGLFGVQKGCNGSLSIFLSIVATWTLLSYMRGEGSLGKMAFISITSLMNAAFSELKFFFPVFVLILLMSAVMTRMSLRKVVVMLFSALCIILFSTFLAVLYEEFEDFLSLRGLFAALTNRTYSLKQDIGRFTAIPMLSDLFLTSVPKFLTGLGLGNCDTSSLAIFNTPFSRSYYLLHYSYFSYAILFLETGILGLGLYLSFFAAVFLTARKLDRLQLADPMVCQSAMILSVISTILAVYNNALRVESAFLLAFTLALPLVCARGRKHDP